MPDQKKLNREQLSAVTHKSGPLLIIAGAGTGKTTVITERVSWLISRGLCTPEEILALTFTEKAAREMEERIDTALPMGYTQTWVTTFHSFCDRILRDEGLHIGLSSDFRILTQTDATALFTRHLFDFPMDYFRPLGNPTKFISQLFQHFSRLQDEDITPETYLKWAQNQPDLKSSDEADLINAEKYLELAQIYSQYSRVKAEASLLDFSDLISYTLFLFRTRPNIRKEYQTKFKYILVDEFQDTNYAQNQLVQLLANSHQNLTVVADDDQSIYRWRGAAVSNVLQFRTTYAKSKLIVLTKNYRSTQEILDRSYDLIKHNNPDRLEVVEKINKHLTATRGEIGSPVQFYHLDRAENEAEKVSAEISRLLESPDTDLKPRDIAILVRANAHADPFIRSLERHHIPCQFLGPGQLFNQPEIKDLVAFLKIMRDPEDDISLFRFLSQPFFGLSAKYLTRLGNFARHQNLHLLSAISTLFQLEESGKSDLPDFPADFMKSLESIYNQIDRHLEMTSTATAGQILFSHLQLSGMLPAITNFSEPYSQTRSENIMKFFNKLKSFEAFNQDASVSPVVDWIDLSTQVGESPAATDTDWTQNDVVNILTLHSAKGLEFRVVFLVNLVSQRFPSMERKEPLPVPDRLIKEILPSGNYHLQEERRLFYVGMTRARDYLYLTAADFYGEGKRAKKMSPFISEAIGDQADRPATASSLQLSILDWQTTSRPQPQPASRPLNIDYLSYSQIETFLDCPLHYKAKYILRLPTPDHAASSFGNTMHLTMRELYETARRGQPLDIEKIYSRNWINSGYLSLRQRSEYYDRGLAYLREYLKVEFDSHRLPIRLECPFNVSLGPLKIGGKIDRVDQLTDGKIEIIDYKTSSKSMTEKEAASDLQLSFYALAATLLPTPPFHRPPQDIKLTLYYFDQQKKVSTTRTASQLHQAREQILAYADEIAHSDFKCSRSIICKHCDFQMLCDLTDVDN